MGTAAPTCHMYNRPKNSIGVKIFSTEKSEWLDIGDVKV